MLYNLKINPLKGSIFNLYCTYFVINCVYYSDSLFGQLEQTLRHFCLKLSNSIHGLKPLSSQSEFDIILHTTEFSAVAFNEEQEQKVLA